MTALKPVAVTGATGQLGRLVIESLKRRGEAGPVRALARAPEKAADLGVETRVADYDRPETLGPALDGVGTLLLISSSEVGKRVPQHRNVIEAARSAGVTRIVYTSLLRADVSPLGLAPEHRETEALLKASGLAATILRNGWYSENYAASIPGALAHGAFLGAAGAGRISSAARADYAEAAAAALLSDRLDGAVLELAGDEAYTLAELAAEISRQAGRDIPYQDLAPADFARALIGAGLPEPLARLLADSDAGAAKGALFEEGRALSTLIGRPTTPMATTVAAVLAA